MTINTQKNLPIAAMTSLLCRPLGIYKVEHVTEIYRTNIQHVATIVRGVALSIWLNKFQLPFNNQHTVRRITGSLSC